MLEAGLGKYEGKEFRILSNLGFLYMRMKNFDKMISFYEKGHEKGYMFPFYLDADPWKTLMNSNEKFRKMVERNNELLSAANAKSEAEFKIVKPEGFSKSEKYPLFIVLHGWGGGLDHLQKNWKSSLLDKGYIVVFIQSSQLVGTGSYGWNDVKRARADIVKCLKHVKTEYPVDENRIILGGFSQGGKTAIGAAVADTIPNLGFIVLAPGGGIPSELPEAELQQAVKSGKKGVIITGSKDHNLAEQKKAAEILKTAGFNFKFEIAEKVSHWFPLDFSERMDKALMYLSGN